MPVFMYVTGYQRPLFVNGYSFLEKKFQTYNKGYLNLIKVASKPLDRIFLNFFKKCSLMCKQS